MKTMANTLFFSHGAGPLPLLNHAAHSNMRAYCDRLIATIPRPDAVIVVSAHWEHKSVRIGSAAHPPLLFDYSNFPEEAYQFTYPCSGHPQLAANICNALQECGIPAALEPDRPLDHGAFVPMIMLYPDASVPSVQVSLNSNMSAKAHIQLGEALSVFKSQNILLVGSGFSFHNMAGFFDNSNEAHMRSHAFERWLHNVVTQPDLPEPVRRQRLINWESAPYARYCHPREEHLLPLHVCYGFAGSASARYDTLSIMNKPASMILWCH